MWRRLSLCKPPAGISSDVKTVLPVDYLITRLVLPEQLSCLWKSTSVFTVLFLFLSSSVREQNRHFQKRKEQQDVLFHVIISEISQALSSGSRCNTPLQAVLPQNCSHSVFYGQVMCSKRSVTQAIAFLVLCLAACNERESTTVFY